MPECRNCPVTDLDPYRSISGRPDDRYADHPDLANRLVNSRFLSTAPRAKRTLGRITDILCSNFEPMELTFARVLI